LGTNQTFILFTMKMTKKGIWKRKVEVHKMEWLYPYVRLEDFMKVCKWLEQENKKLKEELDIATKCSCKEEAWIIRLNEENETLKANIEFLHSCLDDREASIELMKERIRFLEQCLDNKEKVNKSMREELQRYKDLRDSWEF